MMESGTGAQALTQGPVLPQGWGQDRETLRELDTGEVSGQARQMWDRVWRGYAATHETRMLDTASTSKQQPEESVVPPHSHVDAHTMQPRQHSIGGTKGGVYVSERYR
jgi:hypothetical protein